MRNELSSTCPVLFRIVSSTSDVSPSYQATRLGGVSIVFGYVDTCLILGPGSLSL